MHIRHFNASLLSSRNAHISYYKSKPRLSIRLHPWRVYTRKSDVISKKGYSAVGILSDAYTSGRHRKITSGKLEISQGENNGEIRVEKFAFANFQNRILEKARIIHSLIVASASPYRYSRLRSIVRRCGGSAKSLHA